MADPDPQINKGERVGVGGGEGVYPDPEIKGEPGLPKHFFGSSGLSLV